MSRRGDFRALMEKAPLYLSERGFFHQGAGGAFYEVSESEYGS